MTEDQPTPEGVQAALTARLDELGAELERVKLMREDADRTARLVHIELLSEEIRKAADRLDGHWHEHLRKQRVAAIKAHREATPKKRGRSLARKSDDNQPNQVHRRR